MQAPFHKRRISKIKCTSSTATAGTVQNTAGTAAAQGSKFFSTLGTVGAWGGGISLLYGALKIYDRLETFEDKANSRFDAMDKRFSTVEAFMERQSKWKFLLVGVVAYVCNNK